MAEPPRTTDYREDEVSDPGRPRLQLVRGDVELAARDLAPGTYVVGRDPSCDIVLDVSGVSRKHARLTVTADADVEVFDLGSRNGTFVDNRRIDRTSLRDGDEVRFGEAVVQVVWVGRIGPSPARGSASPGGRPSELSEREFEVACLVADGLTNAEIGKRLHISPATVGRHLSNVYARLDIHSRAALAKLVAPYR